LRVVLDTSVFVAALLSSTGASARLVELWLEEVGLEVLISEALLEELRRVLARPKFAGRLTIDEVDSLIGNLRQNALMLEHPNPAALELPDVEDRFLADLALAGQAQVVVTLDRPLLDLASLAHGEAIVPIVSPSTLLTLLRQEGLA
jgi:putative PIN family toxin of toxin-antitoxin system